MKILSFNTDKQIQELSQHIESLSKQIYVLDNRVWDLEKKCGLQSIELTDDRIKQLR